MGERLPWRRSWWGGRGKSPWWSGPPPPASTAASAKPSGRGMTSLALRRCLAGTGTEWCCICRGVGRLRWPFLSRQHRSFCFLTLCFFVTLLVLLSRVILDNDTTVVMTSWSLVILLKSVNSNTTTC
jgi:hypothetical protein